MENDLTNDDKILRDTLAGVARRVEELGCEERFLAALRERFAAGLAEEELERIGEESK